VKHVRIHQAGINRATVEIDGTDIAPAVRGLTVNLQLDEAPRIELDLVVMPFEYDGPADIYVAPASRDLLINAGWTPPAGDQ
jgi:hypothetical protein